MSERPCAHCGHRYDPGDDAVMLDYRPRYCSFGCWQAARATGDPAASVFAMLAPDEALPSRTPCPGGPAQGMPQARAREADRRRRASDALPRDNRRYSADEDALIRRHYGRISQSEIAQQLGRTRAGIDSRCVALGLVPARRFWSESEIALLRGWYAERRGRRGLDLRALAEQLARSPMAVVSKAMALGLTTRKDAR